MVAQAAVLYYDDAVIFLQNNNLVIDITTSYSTKPASWQVSGYPAKAGIQLKHKFRAVDQT
jgi:hypothetical protein